MTKELAFFIFLIERYASAKQIPTGDVMRLWTERGILQEICDCYEMYHQECIENAFDDIEHYLATGTHAW